MELGYCFTVEAVSEALPEKCRWLGEDGGVVVQIAGRACGQEKRLLLFFFLLFD